MQKFHSPCKDNDCCLCLQDIIKLIWILEERTGLNESKYCLSFLDDYQWWMLQNNIDFIEEGSQWGKAIIYEEKTINAYVKWFKATLNDRIKKQIEKYGEVKTLRIPTLVRTIPREWG